jgi:glutamate synthase (NADPH/NADH) large chain
MGTDTPVAVLSTAAAAVRLLPATVRAGHHPPLDADPRELVTSLSSTLGPEGNLLDPHPASCRQIVLPTPILSNSDLAKLLYINEDGDQPGFKSFAGRRSVPLAEGGEGLRRALDDVRTRVSEAIADGAKIIILSDRHSNDALAPIPSLLLVSAVHHTSSGRSPERRSGS